MRPSVLIIFLTIYSSIGFAQKLKWSVIEKEANFLFGFNMQQNPNIPVEIMANDNGFMSSYEPISSGQQEYIPSYSRMYALRFGLRLFFNARWFVRAGVGVQEHFFGYQNNFTHPRGTAEVRARLKYFGIPFDAGFGYSIPFYFTGDGGNVGAINIYGGGFFTALWSPRGQSEVLLNTLDSLDNGRQYQDFVVFEGIQSNRMNGSTGMFGTIAAISVEFNEVTFSFEYRNFNSLAVLNANPLNDRVIQEGINTRWYGHSLEFGVAFRFY
jgi:hypothetical protein